ncbi:MAG: hypothetical protein MUO85_03870, partial [candidate division Zixibacteria bacterium]|nr:hypothetical protein [candidate division Zixibacteria bacterium]
RVSVIAFFNRGFDSMKKSGLCDAFLIPDIDPSKINDAYGYSDTVSRWNLVVCLDEGGAPTIEGGKIASVLKDYMKVGGKVWFTGGGTEIFGYGTPPNTPMIFKNLVPPSSSLTRFLDYVTTYSSLLGVYRSGCGAYTTTQPKEYLGTSAEFVGAEPFDNSEISQLPSLKVDSIKVFNQAPNESLGAPRVAYAGCSYLGEATRIYTFISHPDDVNGSAMDGRPCGSVYKGPIGPEGAPFYGGPIYKTAYMSFPLHFIEEGENGEKRDSLFKAMLEWFWQ